MTDATMKDAILAGMELERERAALAADVARLRAEHDALVVQAAADRALRGAGCTEVELLVPHLTANLRVTDGTLEVLDDGGAPRRGVSVDTLAREMREHRRTKKYFR